MWQEETRGKRLFLTAAAAAVLVTGVAPAFAQYYGDEYGPPRRRVYREEYRDDYGPPRRYGRGGPPICVTSRGSCPYPAPPGSSCRCDIPGFGPKRGIVGG